MTKFRFKRKYLKSLFAIISVLFAIGLQIKSTISLTGELDNRELLEKRMLESLWLKNSSTLDYFQMIEGAMPIQSTSWMDKMLQYNTSKLPKWMKEYFEWHDQHRKLINENNWKDYRYVVLICAAKQCGGTSDRLKPIPYLLRVAYQTKRIFMIGWNRPCHLEEFFLPHKLNWTVPFWLEKIIHEDGSPYHRDAWSERRWRNLAKDEGLSIVQGGLQSTKGGEHYLLDLLPAEEQDENKYVSFYHDMFRMMFRPSPPVARLVEQQMKQYGMVPGEYNVAHYRAFYAVKKESVEKPVLEARAINAMKCASRLSPGSLIYFASDSKFALDTAENYAKEKNNPFARNLNLKEPLHLDFDSRGNQTHPVADYYDSFVDLLVMGSGRCVTFGEGGFGLFASQLSYDANCSSQHIEYHTMNNCEWAEGDGRF